MYRILLVEDDAALADAITQVLTAWGHEVQKVRDFRHVTEEFAEWKPQIVLMDLMLPFFNGHHWTQELRRITSVPIVYLSSASDNLNIVMAMNMGGDDFIAKPVDPAVLAAKVNAVLRRAYDMPATGNILACGEAVLDLDSAALSIHGQSIPLTRNELIILRTLMEQRGRIVSRETLMTRLWQMDEYVEENTLTVNVNRLRKKLSAAGLLALFAGTFALVLSLYHLPTEPVAYASALCAVMGLIALIWGFVRYRRAHQARAHVLNAPHLLLDELPSPRTLSEADDQAIMQRLLHDIRAAQSDLAAYRQDSTDYFTAWVHQIKTPLSVMRLQLQSEDTPENRAMLAELFQMEQYVTMALSYARLGNPTKDLVLTRVPLDPVIRQAIRDFAPLLIRKKLRLQYEPTAESALTDSKWLLFILHQLLSNAVKYTDRGRVSIRVTSAPAIIVADTGIGIAPEDVPRVFEKGYTGYNGRGGQKSTGLGLYLVHQTAEMLHCRVSLSSRIGEGTSVTIDLHQEELGKE